MRHASLIAVLLLSGCTVFTQRNIDEQIKLVKEAGGTGCVYVRGNSRPYADVSVLMVSTIGQGTDYKACLEAVPEGARSLVQPQ